MRNVDESAARRVYVIGSRASTMRVLCELCKTILDFTTKEERAAIEMMQTHLETVHPDVPHPGPYPHELEILSRPPSQEATPTDEERRAFGKAYGEWKRRCRAAHPHRSVTQAEYDQMAEEGTLDPGVRYDIIVRRHVPEKERPRRPIIGMLKHRHRYGGVPGLLAMLDVLAGMDEATPPGTRVDLPDTMGRISVGTSTTKDPKEMAELQKSQYVEVHVVLEGEERIDVVNVDAKAELGEQFEAAPRVVSRRALTLRPGWFAAFLPEHAHHAGGWVDGPGQVLKAVGTLRQSEETATRLER